MTPRNDPNARVTDRNEPQDTIAELRAGDDWLANRAAQVIEELWRKVVQMDRLERAAEVAQRQRERIIRLSAEVERLTADRDAWRAQAEQTYPGKGAKP